MRQLASSQAIEKTKMKTVDISSITVLMVFALECIGQYIFKDEIKLPCTHVKNQAITGARWSLPTIPFIESELLKRSKKELALLQMMNVRIMYLKNSQNYVMRQREDLLNWEGLAPCTLQVMKNYEMISQTAYSGLTVKKETLDLQELDPVLKTFLSEVIKVSHPG